MAGGADDHSLQTIHRTPARLAGCLNCGTFKFRTNGILIMSTLALVVLSFSQAVNARHFKALTASELVGQISIQTNPGAGSLAKTKIAANIVGITLPVASWTSLPIDSDPTVKQLLSTGAWRTAKLKTRPAIQEAVGASGVVFPSTAPQDRLSLIRTIDMHHRAELIWIGQVAANWDQLDVKLTLKLGPADKAQLAVPITDLHAARISRKHFYDQLQLEYRHYNTKSANSNVLMWLLHNLGSKLSNFPAAGASSNRPENILSASQESVHDSQRRQLAVAPTNLAYNGGPVMVNGVTVYFIWYGSSWTAQSQTTIATFISSLGPADTVNQSPSLSEWWSILTHYHDGNGKTVSTNVTLKQPFFDSAGSAGLSLALNDTGSATAILENALMAPSRSEGLPVDENGIYVILTSSEVTVENACSFCAWRNYFTYSDTNLKYIWIPDTSTRCLASCTPFSMRSFLPPSLDLAGHAIVNILSYYLASTVTDPEGTGWYDAEGYWVGTLCANSFGTSVGVNVQGGYYNIYGDGGTQFLVSQLYDLKEKTCTLKSASLPSPSPSPASRPIPPLETSAFPPPGLRAPLSPKPPTLDSSSGSPSTSTSGSSARSTAIYIAVGVAASVFTVILTAILFVFFFKRQKLRKASSHRKLREPELHGADGPAPSSPVQALRRLAQAPKVEPGFPRGGLVELSGGYSVRRFTYAEMEAATESFSLERRLGRGGYSTVFKGTAPDGSLWAVKRAHKLNSGEKDLNEEFQNEVELISRMSHHNLLALRGFCDEAGEQILVYDYMPNGTLKEHLQPDPKTGTRPPLTFLQRLDIAIGSARGLHHLHSFGQDPIIHRDIKTENILLDAAMQAKVADFGLLKPLQEADSHVSTRLAGTIGYMDPQYQISNQVTTKSDVYSFGVVLLELVTGKKPILPSTREGCMPNERETIVRWVSRSLQAGCQMEAIADPTLQLGAASGHGTKVLRRLLRLAQLCTETEGSLRPSMEEVTRRLEEIRADLVHGHAGRGVERQDIRELSRETAVQGRREFYYIDYSERQDASREKFGLQESASRDQSGRPRACGESSGRQELSRQYSSWQQDQPAARGLPRHHSLPAHLDANIDVQTDGTVPGNHGASTWSTTISESFTARLSQVAMGR